MTEEIDFETYLSVSSNKFQIFLFDKKNLINLYEKKFTFDEKFNFIETKNLSKFLDDNIFKIEKLIGKFIKNIFIIIEYDKIFNIDIGIKKKKYDNLNDKKYLENSLIELKDLFKENYQKQIVMHMIINHNLINDKNHSSFTNELSSDHLYLEVNFRSISNDLTIEFEKILEKYQIKISQYLDGNYIKNFFNEPDIKLSEMAYKLRNGCNDNEVILVPKTIESKGFFEKFFQLFS